MYSHHRRVLSCLQVAADPEAMTAARAPQTGCPWVPRGAVSRRRRGTGNIRGIAEPGDSGIRGPRSLGCCYLFAIPNFAAGPAFRTIFPVDGIKSQGKTAHNHTRFVTASECRERRGGPFHPPWSEAHWSHPVRPAAPCWGPRAGCSPPRLSVLSAN